MVDDYEADDDYDDGTDGYTLTYRRRSEALDEPYWTPRRIIYTIVILLTILIFLIFIFYAAIDNIVMLRTGHPIGATPIPTPVSEPLHRV